MTNYKLTTNLIADCMALIPHNLEVLNDNYDFFASGDMDIEYYFNELHPRLKFLNLSHCLRTIQEFQITTIEYLQYKIEIQLLNYAEVFDYSRLHPTKINEKVFVANKKAYCEGRLENIRETIASATLHGQGEYPPSTLEELCESYKNVMSK